MPEPSWQLECCQRFEDVRSYYLSLWQNSSANPFLHPHFARCWWEHYAAPGDQLNLLLLSEQQQPQTLLPLYWHRASRSLQWLGFSPDTAQDEIYSEYPDILGRSDLPEAARQLLRQHLRQYRRLDWRRSLQRQAPLSLPGGQLHQPRGLRYWINTRQGDYTDYLQALRASQRQLIQRRQRRAEREGGLKVLSAHSGDLAPEEAWDLLTALHGDRWVARSGRNLFQQPRFATCHRSLLRSWLISGMADIRVLVMQHTEEPLAAGYWYFTSAGQWYYQSGFSSAHARRLSPMLLLHQTQIRECFSENRLCYDFMQGEMGSYKQDLSTEHDAVQDHICYRSRGAYLGRRLFRATRRIRRPRTQT